MKSEIRNPKSEGSPKSEGQSECAKRSGTGSTGYQPVALGNLPNATEERARMASAALNLRCASSVPSGQWPDGTGRLPVLPARGAERSAGFSPLHRADDEGFRKNPCAGKIRGVKRPEGRAPGAMGLGVSIPTTNK
jgi:hypothetical protein